MAVLKPLKLQAVKKYINYNLKIINPKININSNKLNVDHLNAFFLNCQVLPLPEYLEA